MNTGQSVTVLVSQKHMGNLKKEILPVPLVLGYVPQTAEELIRAAVSSCLKAFRERGEADARPLSDDAYETMRELGKFSFGLLSDMRDVSEEAAQKAALDAFRDGIFRVFSEDGELTDPKSPVNVRKNAVFTFVRLTMLSGRMF